MNPLPTAEINFLLSWRSNYDDRVVMLTVVVGQGEARREFRISRDLFVITSPAFEAMVSHEGFVESQAGAILRFEEDDPTTFLDLILSVHPVYRRTPKDAVDISSLALLADKYGVVQTLENCMLFILSPDTSLPFEGKLLLADRISSFGALKNHCLELMTLDVARCIRSSHEWEAFSLEMRNAILEQALSLAKKRIAILETPPPPPPPPSPPLPTMESIVEHAFFVLKRHGSEK